MVGLININIRDETGETSIDIKQHLLVHYTKQ